MHISLSPEDVAAIADAVVARLNKPPATMTAAQLAKHWGVSVQTIHRRAQAGAIRPIEGLGTMRFTDDEIQRYERT